MNIMPLKYLERNESVTQYLEEAGFDPTFCSRNEWRFTLDGKNPEATARIQDKWFMLDAPLNCFHQKGKLKPEILCSLLTLNPLLPGGCKIVVSGAVPSIHLRMEMPVKTNSDDFGHTIRNILTEFRNAWIKTGEMKSKLNSAKTANIKTGRKPEQVLSDEWKNDINTLIKNIDWTVSEHSADIIVKLDVPGGFFQARLKKDENGGGSILQVDILDASELSSEGEKAAGLLLLKVSGLVKMVRAVCLVQSPDSPNKTALQVFTGLVPSPDHISEALCALSVACRLCGKEVKALKHEMAAREYLRISGAFDSN